MISTVIPESAKALIRDLQRSDFNQGKEIPALRFAPAGMTKEFE